MQRCKLRSGAMWKSVSINLQLIRTGAPLNLRDNWVLEQQITTGKDRSLYTIAKDLEKQMDKNQQSQTKQDLD